MRVTAPLVLGLALLAGCYPKLDILPDNADGDIGLDTGEGGTGSSDGTSGGDDCEVYEDADGDGYGAGAAQVFDCDEVPSGYADNDDDCDDEDADTNPGAAERCDEKDNDCDGAIDNDIITTWYRDADNDGFGNGDEVLEDCDPPSGYSADPSDCDDARSDVNPDADETCDSVDNDCDDEIDEDDAVDAATWYRDSDGDGYGVDDDTLVQCDRPDGYLNRGGDCDDTDNTIRPDATEVCDTVDNDCDGDIDDDDSSVDLTTGSTYWVDGDSDGYGGGAAQQACVIPSTGVENDDDCDDGEAAVNPDASEICDSIDNDCDGAIDDDDSSLDTSTGTEFYVDSDGDGYGDADNAVAACVRPANAVLDDSDCDDGAIDVNPGATEVCDTIDNDCDGAIDDDDSSLDTSTQSTWYADSDNDGEGDATVSTNACSQPSGYVANADDCDDNDANDLDGDGTQDCADDDRDGDGLRNDWDADADDDSIARGPTGGLGNDGVFTLSSSDTQDDWTLLASNASSGGTTLTVDDASAFASGDEALILVQQGSGAGNYEFVFVSGVSGTTLTVEPPLSRNYSASAVVLVQRVPHYTTATISGTLRSETWADGGGGVVIFRATDAVTISGTIDVTGAGFEGGPGVNGNSSASTQGESYNGTGSTSSSNNNGGGGTRSVNRDGCYSGAGGGYGTEGDDGSYRWGTASWVQGGDDYGTSALTTWFLGSGGGGGAPDSESDGNSTANYAGAGGAGGGIVAVYSATSITVNGAIEANGDDGDDAASAGGELGGGGGGAGGQIYLAAPTITVTGDVEAVGGDGGDADSSGISCSRSGGDGGDGRIRALYTSASGSTDPSASTGAYSD